MNHTNCPQHLHCLRRQVFVAGLTILLAVPMALLAAESTDPEPAAPPQGETANEAVERPYLGVGLAPSPMGEDGGVVVRMVAGGSPAAAYLQPGDVLTQLDDQILVHPSQLPVLIGRHEPGDVVRLRVERGDSQHLFAIELAGRSEVEAAAQPSRPTEGAVLPGLSPEQAAIHRRMQEMMERFAEQDAAFEQMRQRMQQDLEALRADVPLRLHRLDLGNLEPADATGFSFRMETRNGETTIIITDADGNVLFSGSPEAFNDAGGLEGVRAVPEAARPTKLVPVPVPDA